MTDVGPTRVRRIRRELLAWEAACGRQYFWREVGRPPFEILIAEILLVKTRADIAAPVASSVLEAFPTPRALAAARVNKLELLLYPLGLHRKRARALVKCAAALVSDFAGEIPRDLTKLMRLPYVGRYAANAIACVAFGRSVPVVDANVARIYQRMFSLPPTPARLATAHNLWALGKRLLPRRQAKQFNWAILDLGGTVCTAKRPDCNSCPVASSCDMATKRSLSLTTER